MIGRLFPTVHERTVIVTGGAGYIGAHVCHALHEAGWLPIIVDNLSTGHRHAVRWGRLVHLDLRDRAALQQLFLDERPQAVIHLAAKSIVQDSVRSPLEYYDHNISGFLSLLSAMEGASTPILLISSSAAVYGNPSTVPIPETAPIMPTHPYGQSKAMIERIALDWASALSTQLLCLRYFNAAGANLSLVLGEDHTPETHLIPRLLQAARHRQPFTVYGQDFNTRDGTAERDYLHVTDLADAHILAMEALLSTASGSRPPLPHCLNVGTEQGTTVLEVIRATEQLLQQPIDLHWGPRRTEDPDCLIADSRTLREELHWAPTRSTLTSILSTAWGWECAKNSYSYC